LSKSLLLSEFLHYEDLIRFLEANLLLNQYLRFSPLFTAQFGHELRGMEYSVILPAEIPCRMVTTSGLSQGKRKK